MPFPSSLQFVSKYKRVKATEGFVEHSTDKQALIERDKKDLELHRLLWKAYQTRPKIYPVIKMTTMSKSMHLL